MKGHDHIIRARVAGAAPSFVFINDFDCKTDWAKHGDHPTVSTFMDAPKTLDMRFLIGLKVSIASPSEKRAKELFEACKKAGAKTVAACHVQEGVSDNKQNGWVAIHHKEVSNG